jgi:adenosine deaminase
VVAGVEARPHRAGGPGPLNDLRAGPKVELHRHLEGSLRLATIFDLSRQAGIELPADTIDGLAPYALATEPVRGLEEALAKFAVAQNSVRTYEAVRRITREAVEDLAADGVRMAELRFSPHFLCEPGDLHWDGALEALLAGLDDGAERDVVVGLVVIFSRNFGLESGLRTVEFAMRHREELVGFDIAGPELEYPPHLYADLVPPIHDAGLGLTVHYGESGPASYVREAVELLGPSRIGHGLSIAQDASVTRFVIERGVTLEMCPTSNWLTHGVETVADHPIRRLLHEGAKVTLNSDDPGLFGIDLTHEWQVARDELGFTGEDFRRVTSNALEASFLPEAVKHTLRLTRFGWTNAPP